MRSSCLQYLRPSRINEKATCRSDPLRTSGDLIPRLLRSSTPYFQYPNLEPFIPVERIRGDLSFPLFSCSLPEARSTPRSTATFVCRPKCPATPRRHKPGGSAQCYLHPTNLLPYPPTRALLGASPITNPTLIWVRDPLKSTI